MAKRIPKPFIDELAARTDLLALLSTRINFTRKSGSNHWACCPFHQEKTPSFSVNTQKGFYHCFGCGVSGDAIRFLMDYDNLPFPEAVEQLAAFKVYVRFQRIFRDEQFQSAAMIASIRKLTASLDRKSVV